MTQDLYMTTWITWSNIHTHVSDYAKILDSYDKTEYTIELDFLF